MTQNVKKKRTQRKSSPRLRPKPEDDKRQAHSLTRSAHVRELAEDYVEAIADLIETNGEARAVDIARRFGVTHVTVIKAVARLQRDGLVTSKPYRSVFLTVAGKALAEQCKARHQVVVDFLCAIGVSHEAAILDSEGIEHHVSDETLEAFSAFIRKRGR